VLESRTRAKLLARQAKGVDFDEKKIDRIFAQLNQCLQPGAAVGIAIAGLPVYRKGFGLASMELPVVLSSSIRMRIYSTTKHFACLAYMLLCEEGRATLDDPVGKYLPELHPVTHPVTMRQLMGHTGGLRDAHEVLWHFSGLGRATTSAEVLSFYREFDDVNFAPGSNWCYNNGGFLLLTVVIERITGSSLEELFRDRILGPVGMHDTLLRRSDTDFVPNSAAMHMTNSKGQFDRSYMGTATAGEGGIVSTVDDMLRWLAHMDAPVVGSPASWALMKTAQTLTNGKSTGYGLGLLTGRYRGAETISHPGGGFGANSQMLKVPSAGLDIVIMVNRHDVSAVTLADEILAACLPDLEPIGEACGTRFGAGTFRSAMTLRVLHLFGQDGKQFVSIDGTDVPLRLDEDGALRPAGSFGYMKWELRPSGAPERPDSIRSRDFGNPDEWVRVNDDDRPDARAIVGQYRSAATGTEATIRETERGLQLITGGRFGSMTYTLEPLATGIWRTQPFVPAFLGGILSFDREGAGFCFSTLRTRALPFRRRA
jgi:D-aminopeptidase